MIVDDAYIHTRHVCCVRACVRVVCIRIYNTLPSALHEVYMYISIDYFSKTAQILIAIKITFY